MANNIHLSDVGVTKHSGNFGGLPPTLDIGDGVKVGDIAIDTSQRSFLMIIFLSLGSLYSPDLIGIQNGSSIECVRVISCVVSIGSRTIQSPPHY